MLADFVDGDDVGVVELGSGFGFAAEAGQVGPRGGGAGEDDLEGDDAVEAFLPGAIDDAHAAAAEFFEQFVIVETLRDAAHAACFHWRLIVAAAEFFSERGHGPKVAKIGGELRVVVGDAVDIDLFAGTSLGQQLLNQCGEAGTVSAGFVACRFWKLVRHAIYDHACDGVSPSSDLSCLRARTYRMPAAGSVRPSSSAACELVSCSACRMRMISRELSSS